MTSLIEYAKDNGSRKSGPACWLCGIADRAEVEEAFKKGVPQVVIFRWLKEKKGYAEASLSRVKSHLASHAR